MDRSSQNSEREIWVFEIKFELTIPLHQAKVSG